MQGLILSIILKSETFRNALKSFSILMVVDISKVLQELPAANGLTKLTE